MKSLIKNLTFVMALFIQLNSWAQENHTILESGLVKNSINDQPIAGASIKSIRTNLIVGSDKNGAFSLKISFPDTLVVQFMGFKTDTVFIHRAGSLKIYLTPIDREIEEVLVNSGYQQLSSKEITGSVQVLPREDLQRQVGTNILDRLNNVATGVLFKTSQNTNPQQKLGLSVRGLSSINGPMDPLVVLDGFIYEGNIANIDPNSIESISILKDASAASIWGARAGNGVIVLTSKNGTLQHDKVKVTFDQSFGFQAKSNLKSIYQMSNQDFISVEKMLFAKGYYDRQITSNPENALTPVIEVLLARRQGTISPSDSVKVLESLLKEDGKRNFSNLFQSNPYLGQSFLNLSGKMEKMSYNIGAGYTSNTTESKTESEKFNFYMSNNYMPIKGMEIGINLTYSQNSNRSGMPSYNQLVIGGKELPYMKILDEQGDPLPFDTRYRKAFMENFHKGKLLDWNYYPSTDYLYSKNKVLTNDMFLSARGSYQVFAFLKVQLGLQYQKESQIDVTVHDKESFYARNMINAYTEINPTTGAVTYRVPNGGIKSQSTTQRNAYTARIQTFFSEIFSKHYINGILGAEIRENGSEGIGQTLYGYSDDPLRSTAVDYVTRFRTLPIGGASVILGNSSPNRRLNRFVSSYFNMVYLYNQRYGLSASVRKDGGNIFGVHTNDRWNPFWSVGLSWNITKEEFFKQEIFENLKLRSTIGYSGNVDLGKTSLPIASNISGRFTDFPALVISSLNDPGLRWEKVRTTNIGIDFALKGGLVSGSIDAFVKRGVDLYGLTLYDYTAWGKSPTITTNTASMKGEGLEANLLFDFFKDKRLRWNSNLLFNYSKNTTTDYYHSGQEGITSFLGDGSRITPIVGKPLNAIAGYTWAGLDANGNPQGYLNGVPSTDYAKIREEANQKGVEGGNISFIGSAVPQLYGALINTLSFGKIDLAVNVSYRADYYFKNPTTSYTQLFKTGVAYEDFDRRWQSPGDEMNTNVPAMGYPTNEARDNFYGVSDINILKADHIRLEYINLSWSPTFRTTNKVINGSIFLNTKNLGTLWAANNEGIDPDYAGRLKPPFVFTLGLRMKL